MSPGITIGATIAAVATLLVAATAATAHEAHEKQAIEASSEPPAIGVAVPAPSAEAEATPHHHGNASFGVKVESNLPKPLAWLGRLHPPATHFPIALLIAAALAELLYMRSGSVLFDHAVRFTVWFGAVGAVGGAILGWLFAGFRLVDEQWVMTAHRWAGTSTALLAAGLLYLLERSASGAATRRSFRLVLFSASTLVGGTGFLGGSLLYGLDHYSW